MRKSSPRFLSEPEILPAAPPGYLQKTTKLPEKQTGHSQSLQVTAQFYSHWPTVR